MKTEDKVKAKLGAVGEVAKGLFGTNPGRWLIAAILVVGILVGMTTCSQASAATVEHAPSLVFDLPDTAQAGDTIETVDGPQVVERAYFYTGADNITGVVYAVSGTNTWYSDTSTGLHVKVEGLPYEPNIKPDAELGEFNKPPTETARYRMRILRYALC